MLKNKVEDSMEAQALEFRREKIDIYSSSWGPVDDGKKMDGPGLLVKKAFEEGVIFVSHLINRCLAFVFLIIVHQGPEGPRSDYHV